MESYIFKIFFMKRDLIMIVLSSLLFFGCGDDKDELKQEENKGEAYTASFTILGNDGEDFTGDVNLLLEEKKGTKVIENIITITNGKGTLDEVPVGEWNVRCWTTPSNVSYSNDKLTLSGTRENNVLPQARDFLAGAGTFEVAAGKKAISRLLLAPQTRLLTVNFELTNMDSPPTAVWAELQSTACERTFLSNNNIDISTEAEYGTILLNFTSAEPKNYTASYRVLGFSQTQPQVCTFTFSFSNGTTKTTEVNLTNNLKDFNNFINDNNTWLISLSLRLEKGELGVVGDINDWSKGEESNLISNPE